MVAAPLRAVAVSSGDLEPASLSVLLVHGGKGALASGSAVGLVAELDPSCLAGLLLVVLSRGVRGDQGLAIHLAPLSTDAAVGLNVLS